MSDMSASVTWLNNEAINFEIVSGSGHKVIIDSAQELGARPMELILMGLGGCASYDVVSILKKSRQAISDVRCEVSACRADSVPAVFTDIHLHFIVAGENIKESQVAKAIELSADKYCSASKMLADGGVNITHDFEIVATA
ncbi:osmotically inducible protein OsmC [Moraxella bovis]|uniref:OsmC-like protein n=2 Tax=Moraxella bovis TaxID=476 RepID=A0A1T0A072_MORBO|nr:osmotically inducible protein OsmC [Moraxella bovis]STY90484.1 OsmC-like protein [Moraxella bovis]